MAIRIMPQAAIEPVRSQTGGVDGRVEPVRDASAGSLLAVGEGATDLGRAVTVAADRAQDQVDNGMSLHLSSLYTEEDENEMDAPGGFMTTQGKDATPERWKQSRERLRQKRQKLEDMAQNNAQKQNFAEHAERIDARSRSRANAHYVQETRVFESGERKAAADAGIREAIKYAGTDEGEIRRMEAMRHYDKWGALLGEPPSKVAEVKQKAMDEYHAGVVGRIVEEANNPPAARLYFDKHKGEMSPETETRIGAYVQRAGIQDKAMRAVDEMAAKGMTVDQMRGWAAAGHQGGTVTAAERAAIEDRAAWYGRDQAHKAAVSENGVRAAAEQWLVDNPLQGVSAMPAELYRGVETTGQLGDINTFAKTRRYSTDPQAFLAALRTPDEVWKQATKEQVERAFRGKLDDDDLRKVHEMHEAALQPKYNKLSILSPEKMVEDTARRIGILPAEPDAKPSEKQALAYGDFRREFNTQLDAWQENHKKRAEEADVQKLLDARAAQHKQKVLVMESETTSGFGEFFWRGLDAIGGDAGHMDRTLVETDIGSLTPAQQGRAFVRTGSGTVVALRDIPQAQRDRIREYIESKGETPTLQAITDYWNRLGRPAQ